MGVKPDREDLCLLARTGKAEERAPAEWQLSIMALAEHHPPITKHTYYISADSVSWRISDSTRVQLDRVKYFSVPALFRCGKAEDGILGPRSGMLAHQGWRPRWSVSGPG